MPTWDDEYFDRVSGRLMFSYDLERDYRVRGESFDLYGEFRVRTQKQFFHPALSYADHDRAEYLFARRVARPAVDDLESLVELGHDLADDWIVPSEEHFGTEFTFVVVADELTESVREFVEGFRERELLAYGYYGHYEINLVVVAPTRRRLSPAPRPTPRRRSRSGATSSGRARASSHGSPSGSGRSCRWRVLAEGR
ncbi:hypothetical protein SY89_02107 [Halolamina pelagica]|uniref:DUF8052 domain-containing protein n=1 Tax=Halolamina pelagica TaxID=699431 RepID=A0A0N8I055_9EURY|nr:hypothetical protein SY89_02107 [Halolamina pelagica]